MNYLKKLPYKIKLFLFILPLLFIYTLICSISYVNAISTDLQKNVFRLHVIANSDSEDDQNLKLKVRDNVIKYMNTLCSKTTSKEEAIEIANAHLNEFKKIALSTIKENGYNYDVDISIDNVFFPTKTYGDISLPEGYYDALRIKIGKAEGKNWWCVMFPPLCFVDVTSGIVPDDSKELLKENLSQEEYDLICNGNSEDLNNSDITFKFKIVELLNNTKMMLASKN